MKTVIPVVAAVIVKCNDAKEVLLSYRETDESPEAEQNWEFPGGVIKYGEAPEQALEREIQEELGFNISIKRLLYAQSNIYSSKKHYLVLYYECSYLARLFVPKKHSVCRWYYIEYVEKLPTLPGTRMAIKALKGTE